MTSTEPDAAKLVRVGLEVGRTWVFASALDWPGWCRRGKGEAAAIEELAASAVRYAAVVGNGVPPGDLAVVGCVAGDATTDFGAPGQPGPWDDEALPAAEAGRLTGLLERCWSAFDDVVAAAPAELRKGPRGGGRDRDAVVEHVREAERSYGRSTGVRVPPRTPWAEQRAALAAMLRVGGTPDARWTARYATRRIAWHVLDHAWEIEDRSS